MKQYPFDTDAANAELDAANLGRGADGKRFALRIVYTPEQGGFNETAEILRANWASLGVDLILEARERNTWIEQVFVKRDFDISITFYFAGVDPVIGVERAYLCSEIRPVVNTNASQHCNEQLDALLDAARATTDAEERKELYWQAQEIISHDLPTAVLMDSLVTSAVSDSFGNLDLFFQVHNDAGLKFADIYKRS
jgi:peptide/nickel transport system substrate-binding protein